MNNLKIIIVFLLSTFSSNLLASFAYIPMPEMIKNTDIIFSGTLIESYVKREHVSNKSNYIGGIYTTYIFSISEILKGEYQADTIEVKKYGGCDEEAGHCVSISTEGFSYTNNAQALMFVKYNDYINGYRSYQGDITAYQIQGSLELLTDSSGSVRYIDITNENKEKIKALFTVKILRNLIKKTTNLRTK